MKNVARIFLVLMAVGVAVTIIYTSGLITNPGKYDEADALLNSGSYEEAAAAFEALGNFRDAPLKAAEAKNNYLYIQAGGLLDDKEFLAAYNIFKELGSFKDSASRLPEIDGDWWAHTLALGSMQACEEYMSLPGAAYAEEAAAEYGRLYAAEQERLAFEAYTVAAGEGTIPALDEYMEAWSQHEYADEYIALALALTESMKSDGSLSAPLLGNPKGVTNEDIDAFLRDFPGHIDELKVRALNEGDFIELMTSGVISLSIKGNSIENTNVTLTSKSNRDLTVTIPIGAYFDPGNTSVQNMVVREPKTLKLSAGGSTTTSIKTACMNIRRSIPNSSNTFSAQALDGDSKLKRVVALCDEKKATYAVTQAAVWIVTDNPSDNSLLSTLVYSGGGRAITSDDLAKAKEIVREAG
ncbi:MAG: hypothetical protein FWH01_06285 [Oscillospiraceae bacterium]|nr:hypothetical protein [Oscillospiraceae bacterium]